MNEQDTPVLEKRIANMQTVTGLVIHTMNNLISGMYGMAQLAQATGKEEYTSKTVEMAAESCKRMKILLQEFSEYSGGLAGAQGEVPVSRMIEKALVILGRELEKKEIRPVTDLGDGLRVGGCEADVQELMFHLLRSAIESIEQTGDIRIRTSAPEEGIEVVFSDTGVSVPELSDIKSGNIPDSEDEHVQKAFEELVYALEVIGRIGGSMSIEKADSGKTVRVVLKQG